MTRVLAAALLLASLALPALAHKASDAYVTFERDATTLAIRWDLALRDLELALGLDADGDGQITWGELRARHEGIARYALSRLALSSDGVPCALRVVGHEVDRHADGAYAVVRLAGTCERDGALDLAYSALFDVDAQHRALVNVVEDGHGRSVVFAAETGRQRVGAASGAVAHFASYVGEGMRHIAGGFDHLLFLLSLLLPAVLTRRGGAWHAATSLRLATWDAVRVVTAFTVAHSITLTLAVVGVIALPPRLVESVIAASVVVAALNNLWPVVDRGRWIVAFAFGLVHGLGFATALTQLGLARGSLALSLAGFNIGVELGQLAVIALFLPLAFALRGSPAYRRAYVAGSVAIAALASLWLAERALDVVLLGAGR